LHVGINWLFYAHFLIASLTFFFSYIPEDLLPDFLGGACIFETAATKDGPPWIVPKTEYSIQGEELLRENTEDILTSIYTSATINRGFPHEV
jgi:hypothetical protein